MDYWTTEHLQIYKVLLIKSEADVYSFVRVSLYGVLIFISLQPELQVLR